MLFVDTLNILINENIKFSFIKNNTVYIDFWKIENYICIFISRAELKFVISNRPKKPLCAYIKINI